MPALRALGHMSCVIHGLTAAATQYRAFGASYSVAQIASSAGIASHNKPLTRKKRKPQKPRRFIHVLNLSF